MYKLITKDSTQGHTKPLHSCLGCMGGIPYAANLRAKMNTYNNVPILDIGVHQW